MERKNPAPGGESPAGGVRMRGMSPRGWAAEQLCLRARECMASGRLPTTRTTMIIAGYGSGKSPCDLCDEMIATTQVEYRVTDPRGGGRELTLHFACHFSWPMECGRHPPGA